MSLTSEINRTETEKNKTKTVAVNIDNKLVELGGEQAINLADVPNKIKKLAEGAYKKATGNCDIHVYFRDNSTGTIPLNVKFNVKRVIFYVEYIASVWGTLDSKYHNRGPDQEGSTTGGGVGYDEYYYPEIEIDNTKKVAILKAQGKPDVSVDIKGWIALG